MADYLNTPADDICAGYVLYENCIRITEVGSGGYYKIDIYNWNKQ